MSLPLSQTKRLDELATAIAEGEASTQQFDELQQLLTEDQQLRKRYVAYMQMRARLELDIGDLLEDESVGAVGIANPPTRMQRLARFLGRPTPFSVAAAALVIGLLITTMAFMAPPFYRAMTQGDSVESETPRVVAQLTGKRDVVWADGQLGQRDGAHLPIGHAVELIEGLIEITYTNGAQVVVEGPAMFEISGAGTGVLQKGKLAAYVPKAATGFTISLPSAEVIDLGTRFAALVEGDRQEVHVIDGTVKVTHNDGRTHVLLGAGEAVSLNGQSSNYVSIPSDPGRFAIVLPEVEELLKVQGSVKIVDHLPMNESGFLGHADQAILFHEAENHTLTAPVQVDIATPGGRRTATSGSVNAGVKVDVYLVHYHPTKRGKITGEVRFPRRVLGVIIHTATLLRSEEQLGLNVHREPASITAPIGLDDDEFELLPDRQTVRFTLLAVRADDFRVLIASEDSTKDAELMEPPMEE